MSARIVILIVVAAGLAVYLATRTTAPADQGSPAAEEENDDIREIRELQLMLWERDLPGEEPDVPPDLSIRVEADPSGKKNRLHYYITEANGFYVETFNIEFHYKETPESTRDESPLTFTAHVNDYVKANETLASCVDVVPAELVRIGRDMGTSENWDVEILRYGRARAKNPERLPPLARAMSCD